MLKSKNKRATTTAGYSLVEVLVAIVVLSLSLLGFAALQITGLTSNKIAGSRSQASVLAYVITDAMRANRGSNNEFLSQYVHTLGTAKPSGGMPAQDVSDWLTAVGNQLPSGDGGISVDTTTNIVTVTVQWSENKSGTPSQFQITTRL